MNVRKIPESELVHYGIKGQRKGNRRYQYYNKTYTPAGNERYRPSKGIQKKAITATAAASGIAWLAAVNNATGIATTMSTMASTALSSISSNIIGVGSAVVSGLLSVPVPVAAIAIPVGILAVSSISTGKTFVEDMLGDEYGRKKNEKWY